MLYKKFLKVVVLFLLIISLVSCKNKQESFLGISKVEITTNLFYEKPHLELFIFSTTDYHNLMIENKYFEHVKYQRENISLIKDNLVIDGYLHYFDIYFLNQEFSISKIKLKHQNDLYEVNIGSYQSIYLEPSNIDIKSSCDIYGNIGIINYQNNIYKPIYIKEIKNLTINKNHSVTINNHFQTVIYSKQLKSLEILSFEINKKYHQIGGIIKTSFYTNLEEYYIYSTYYYSSMPSFNKLKDGIDINYLEIIN